jgi:hypothetical protein
MSLVSAAPPASPAPPVYPSPARIRSAAPEAPTKPAETPVDIPTRQEPPPGEKERETPSEPDIDEQIKRIIREMPDPRPQPGGE